MRSVVTASTQKLLDAFDGHDIESVRTAIQAGADPRSEIEGKRPVNWLLEQYWRSERLPHCLKLLFDHGATLLDESLIPVLLDDGNAVTESIQANPALLKHRTSLISAFTALVDVTLLHVAAEYGNYNSARALIELGADVNAPAGLDEHGLNGHTPLFHTVNSIFNFSEPTMRLLLDAGASVENRVNGIWWGKGYPWETIFFDVTPISYAQMGMMPQVHRAESDIYSNIQKLMIASGRSMPTLKNIPNRYLR